MQKLGWVIAFLAISLHQEWWNPLYIFQTNKAKKEAQRYYNNNDYASASEQLNYLKTLWKVEEPTVTLNLGHAYFKLQDTSSAIYYKELVNTKEDKVRSIANLQLGVLQVQRTKKLKPEQQKDSYKKALENFKDALRADETNEAARFDYELLKRLMELQQEQQQQNQDQQNKEEQQQNEQDQQEQEQQNKEEQQQNEQDQQEQEQQNKQEQQQEQSVSDKLKDMEITKEKAEQILDAMRQDEAQYLQQQQRKGRRKRNRNKPDW